MSALDGIAVVQITETEALVLLTIPAAHVDFLSRDEPFIVLRSLDASAARAFAEVVERALDQGVSTGIEFNGTTLDVIAERASILFHQAGRKLSMSRDTAREVWRQCASVAGKMNHCP